MIYIENITDYMNDIIEMIYSSGVDFSGWLKEHNPLQFPSCYAQPEVEDVKYSRKEVTYPDGKKEVTEEFDHPGDVVTKWVNEGYEFGKNYLKEKYDL